jgi:hypothetical protein
MSCKTWPGIWFQKQHSHIIYFHRWQHILSKHYCQKQRRPAPTSRCSGATPRRPALVPAKHFSHRLKNPEASMVLNSFSDTLHIPLHKSESEEMVFNTHRRGTLTFSACRASGSSRRNGLSFTISLVSFLNAISV